MYILKLNYIFIVYIIYIYRFVYIVHHFILLQLNPFDFMVLIGRGGVLALYAIVAGLIISGAC